MWSLPSISPGKGLPVSCKRHRVPVRPHPPSPVWLLYPFCNSGLHLRACSCVQLDPHGLQPPRLLCPWDSPGKNTGVGCHALLQGIFLTQGPNRSLMPPALAGGFFTTTWEFTWGLKDTFESLKKSITRRYFSASIINIHYWETHTPRHWCCKKESHGLFLPSFKELGWQCVELKYLISK